MPRLELREWAERFGLVAGVTTRGHGFSLGLWSAESVGQVMTRWRAFRAALQGSFPAAVLSHQVHGTEVRWHDTPADGWLLLEGIDGHATARPGLLLTVTVADCKVLKSRARSPGRRRRDRYAWICAGCWSVRRGRWASRR
ncbi:MAG: hypothetical protein DMD74_06645 [Gemmatimonadetes bacterium]|nr:MAG: hypothetical protein DMD74_06645 [Gemmatimonadota bacterium]